MKREKTYRTAIMLSLGMNILLFVCLWILEARVSKLESSHDSNTALELSFP